MLNAVLAWVCYRLASPTHLLAAFDSMIATSSAGTVGAERCKLETDSNVGCWWQNMPSATHASTMALNLHLVLNCSSLVLPLPSLDFLNYKLLFCVAMSDESSNWNSVERGRFQKVWSQASAVLHDALQAVLKW